MGSKKLAQCHTAGECYREKLKSMSFDFLTKPRFDLLYLQKQDINPMEKAKKN